jgi:hypothetical protein
MTADTAAVGLVLLAAPAITLYAPLFTFNAPWWRSPVGRAHFATTWGLMLLIDISLAYQWLGDDYALRDVVRLTVFALIAAACWLSLGAWFYERRKASRL